MPCGGIYPARQTADGTIKDKVSPTDGGCWECGRGGAKHFCDEWDTYIHARCVPKFLQSSEGEIVILHKHTVVLDFSLEESYAR